MSQETLWRRLIRSVAILAAALLFYYFVPLRDERSNLGQAAGFLVGLGVLVFLVTLQVRHQLRAPDNEVVRLYSLLAMLYVVVVFFSLAYLQIERLSPGQFVDLQTRTDALYFTVATLGTVGYGDVHPVGQTARIFATAQIGFDLVFVAALISVFTNRVGRVVAARRAGGGD